MSSDRGDSWTRISPDLTTNDPEKQKQDQSGGITKEATGAENHCTVITISPSPLTKGVIWAGTDDGMIQVTEDGGTNWKNTSQNIKGMPRNGWVPQVTASAHQAGEAFAVVNDYRQGDNAAYLFRTKDYGRSWQRIIDDTDVWGYVLCFVQDPVEPNLMFAGTEYGLYVSFDGGDNWNRWTSGYPTVSTYDMTIQPRESDLVIATFGRALWVLDDIRPLRALAFIRQETAEHRAYCFRGSGGISGLNKEPVPATTFTVTPCTADRTGNRGHDLFLFRNRLRQGCHGDKGRSRQRSKNSGDNCSEGIQPVHMAFRPQSVASADLPLGAGPAAGSPCKVFQGIRRHGSPRNLCCKSIPWQCKINVGNKGQSRP